MTSELLDPGVDFFASRTFEWTGGPYRALGHTFQSPNRECRGVPPAPGQLSRTAPSTGL